MILGFAHITKNEAGFGRPGSLIENPPEKWALMARPAKRQILALYKNCSGPSEEVGQYDTGLVDGYGRLGVCDRDDLLPDDYVRLAARDAPAEAEFFIDGLGFEVWTQDDAWTGDPGALMRLTSRFAHWSLTIALLVHPKAPLDPPLDIKGYAALAFYSTDVEADRDRAIAAGGRTPTEPFTVTIKDREMKIIMLRSPEGTIIELIQVKP